MTPDKAALKIMLSNATPQARQRALSRLAARVSDYQAGKVDCPECGHAGPHDHNGDRQDPAFSCAGCGLCFEDRGA